MSAEDAGAAPSEREQVLEQVRSSIVHHVIHTLNMS